MANDPNLLNCTRPAGSVLTLISFWLGVACWAGAAWGYFFWDKCGERLALLLLYLWAACSALSFLLSLVALFRTGGSWRAWAVMAMNVSLVAWVAWVFCLLYALSKFR